MDRKVFVAIVDSEVIGRQVVPNVARVVARVMMARDRASQAKAKMMIAKYKAKVASGKHAKMVDSGAAVSGCPLGYAPETPMTNHSRRATLRTATGAQIEHAGQKTVEYEKSDGGSVNVSFEVADVTRPLVAVGELQKRGMTVVMGPHGSFVTRGHVKKPPGSNLDLEHSDGA